ncbi:MAG: STAS domain-containing protein [Bryobacteraceae bacterium]
MTHDLPTPSPPGALALGGPLTVARAAGIRSRLLDAAAGPVAPDSLAIDLSGAGRIDASILQLLAAARLDALRRGSSLTISSASAEAEASMVRSGFGFLLAAGALR